MKRCCCALLRLTGLLLLTLLLPGGGMFICASHADTFSNPHSDIASEGAQSEVGAWVSSPEGQTLLHSFHNAPYPHASRDKGYTYEGKVFDVGGHYSDSTVGIFIPAGYQAGEAVDYVVHFHGWSNYVASVLDHYALPR